MLKLTSSSLNSTNSIKLWKLVLLIMAITLWLSGISSLQTLYEAISQTIELEKLISRFKNRN